MLPCRSCGNLSYREARRNNARRSSMNKGAMEYFQGLGRLQTSLEEGRSDTDANRIERIGVETGHGSSLWMPRPGTIRWKDWQPGGRVCSGISWATDLYIYPLPGSLPVGPSSKDRAECVESVPTSRHVLSSENFEIEFFFIGSFRKRVRSGEAGSVKRIIIQRVIQGIG